MGEPDGLEVVGFFDGDFDGDFEGLRDGLDVVGFLEGDFDGDFERTTRWSSRCRILRWRS